MHRSQFRRRKLKKLYIIWPVESAFSQKQIYIFCLCQLFRIALMSVIGHLWQLKNSKEKRKKSWKKSHTVFVSPIFIHDYIYVHSFFVRSLSLFANHSSIVQPFDNFINSRTYTYWIAQIKPMWKQIFQNKFVHSLKYIVRKFHCHRLTCEPACARATAHRNIDCRLDCFSLVRVFVWIFFLCLRFILVAGWNQSITEITWHWREIQLKEARPKRFNSKQYVWFLMIAIVTHTIPKINHFCCCFLLTSICWLVLYVSVEIRIGRLCICSFFRAIFFLVSTSVSLTKVKLHFDKLHISGIYVMPCKT